MRLSRRYHENHRFLRYDITSYVNEIMIEIMLKETWF